MPDIYWLIRAQRSLEEALCLMNHRRQYATCYAEFCRVLFDTFPIAAAVIVRDRLKQLEEISTPIRSIIGSICKVRMFTVAFQIGAHKATDALGMIDG